MMRPLLTQATLALALLAGPAGAQLPPGVEKPQPTVPEVFTLMGQFVRVAYNNQGFVTLGYRMAQEAVGEDWVMLDVGLTVRTSKGVTLKRGDFSVQTPDGKIVPLATQQDFAKAGYLSSLHMRAKVNKDSINYFPVEVRRGCPIQFFANLGQGGRQLAFDQVELSNDRACVGRLYFQIPGGIKPGQHWLKVAYPEGEVQVPFRILTPEERKEFEKSWEDIKKAHDESLEQQ